MSSGQGVASKNQLALAELPAAANPKAGRVSKASDVG